MVWASPPEPTKAMIHAMITSVGCEFQNGRLRNATKKCGAISQPIQASQPNGVLAKRSRVRRGKMASPMRNHMPWPATSNMCFLSPRPRRRYFIGQSPPTSTHVAEVSSAASPQPLEGVTDPRGRYPPHTHGRMSAHGRARSDRFTWQLRKSCPSILLLA
jgi:hypothetical protein